MTDPTDYVLQHYPNLMTEHEREVLRHLELLYKFRDHGPPEPGTAAEIPDLAGPIRRRFSTKPNVIADAQAGWEAARRRITERILSDHPDDVYLNLCPECGALTRTPRARLCLTCGHTWFHIPRDVRPVAASTMKAPSPLHFAAQHGLTPRVA